MATKVKQLSWVHKHIGLLPYYVVIVLICFMAFMAGGLISSALKEAKHHAYFEGSMNAVMSVPIGQLQYIPTKI